MTPFSATCPIVAFDKWAASYCMKPLPALSQTCMRENGAERGGAISGHAPTSVRNWILAGVSVLTLLAGASRRGGLIAAGSWQKHHAGNSSPYREK